MSAFFATLQAALGALPHSIATLISCSLFAAHCSTPVTLLSLPHRIDASTTQATLVTSSKPVSNNTVHIESASPSMDSTPHSSARGSSESHTSIVTSNSHSGETRVTTMIDGKTESYTIPESSGVQTVFISNTVNGKTTTYASSSPVSQEKADQMEAEMRDRAANMQSDIENSIQHAMDSFGNF